MRLWISLAFVWPHFCLAGIKRRTGGFRRLSRSTGRSVAGWCSWNKHWRIWIWTQTKGSDKEMWQDGPTMSSKYSVRLLDPLPLQIPWVAAWSHSVLPVWFLRVAFFFLGLKISKNVLLIMTSISSIWPTWACVAAGTLPVGSNLCVGTVEACSCCSHDCFYSWGKGEAPRALLKSTLHRDLWLCCDVMRQVKHVSLQAPWQPTATH